MSRPHFLLYVYTTPRGEVSIFPEVLTEVLHYNFSSLGAVTQLVSYMFDRLDPPKQIIAKVFQTLFCLR